jgi:hypothetical protein
LHRAETAGKIRAKRLIAESRAATGNDCGSGHHLMKSFEKNFTIQKLCTIHLCSLPGVYFGIQLIVRDQIPIIQAGNFEKNLTKKSDKIFH